MPPEKGGDQGAFLSVLTAKVYAGVLVAAIVASLGQGILQWRDFAVFRSLFLEHKSAFGHEATTEKLASIQQYVAEDKAIMISLDRRLDTMENAILSLDAKLDILITKDTFRAPITDTQ